MATDSEDFVEKVRALISDPTTESETAARLVARQQLVRGSTWADKAMEVLNLIQSDGRDSLVKAGGPRGRRLWAARRRTRADSGSLSENRRRPTPNPTQMGNHRVHLSGFAGKNKKWESLGLSRAQSRTP